MMIRIKTNKKNLLDTYALAEGESIEFVTIYDIDGNEKSYGRQELEDGDIPEFDGTIVDIFLDEEIIVEYEFSHQFYKELLK